jgi:steroid delta-isomerase-like uncharacterized protein
MTTLSDHVALLRTHIGAELQHDMEATLDTLHPECVFEDVPLEWRLEGREGARQHYAFWWGAFGVKPDVAKGRQFWAGEDTLIAESAFIGTHRGSFLGFAPTGKEIYLPFIVTVSFRDGKMSGERFMYDLNTLLRQIGASAIDPARRRSA